MLHVTFYVQIPLRTITTQIREGMNPASGGSDSSKDDYYSADIGHG